MRQITRYVLLFLIGWLSQLSPPLCAAELQVAPLLIEIKTRPGARELFNFQVLAHSPGKLNLSVWDLQQQADGHMRFSPADPEQPGPAAWVKLDRQRLQLGAGQSVQVKGRLKVPATAAGTYLSSIMIEEQRPEAKVLGIRASVRYAITLKVQVVGRAQRIQGAFSDLALVEREGQQWLQGRFENRSHSDHLLESRVQLRDQQGRPVIQVKLKSASAWQRHSDSSRIFPGASVELYAPLKKPLRDGHYQVWVRNRFGGHHQPTLRTELILSTADEVLKNNPLRYAEQTSSQQIQSLVQLPTAQLISPLPVALKQPPKGDSYGLFVLQNPFDEPIKVQFPDPKSTPQAALKSYSFSPQQVTLAPNKQVQVLLKQHFHDPYLAAPVHHRVRLVQQILSRTLVLPTVLQRPLVPLTPERP